jgi:xanthine/uracil permease
MALLQWNERPAQVLQGGGVIGPDERLPWAQTGLMGIQHVIAMFGATFLVPILTGFDPSTTLFFTAMSTALFLLINKNMLPSYLGSSFGFIAPIAAVASAHETAQAIQADITYSKAAARDAAILESRCKTLRGPGAELVMVGTNGDYACRVITSK